MEKDGRKEVFVVRDARVHLSRISIGLEKDDLVEIMSGLKEGETVVVAGQPNLKDGDKVIIEEGDEG
jgi:multidrug efflux pump subunit AcrA (membrane-fusion protein)